MAGPSQDEELYLPRTVMNKLIKEIVPNIRVSNEAKDLLLNCCSEFIHLLASEASEISENQHKKVMSPEHIIEALQTLGFNDYIEDVKEVFKEYKEQASKHRRKGKSRLERLGVPEEELHRQQQELFEQARQQQLENELLEQQQAMMRTHSVMYQSLPGTSQQQQQPPPLPRLPNTTEPNQPTQSQ